MREIVRKKDYNAWLAINMYESSSSGKPVQNSPQHMDCVGVPANLYLDLPVVHG